MAFPQITFPSLGHNHRQTAQSIEDFEAQMAAARTLLPDDERGFVDPPGPPPPAYSKNDSGNGAIDAAPAAPPSSSFSSSSAPSSSQPQQQSQPQPLQSSPPNDQPPLRAGRAWSSESVAAFNNLCLKNAVANTFDYEQCRPMPPGWAVRLTFSFYSGVLGGKEDGGEDGAFVVELPGPYGTKKEAKAAAAERGLAVLTEALERRKAAGVGAGAGKRKQTGEDGANKDGEEDGMEVDEEEVLENWVGLLGGGLFFFPYPVDAFSFSHSLTLLPAFGNGREYCQAENKPRPKFQEFSLGANYSMECIMPAEEGRGEDEPFGGRNVLFNSKKAAKTNAAREAVHWLRQTGRMPKTGHPTKKKMKAAAMATAGAGMPASASGSNASAAAAAGPPLTPMPIGGNNNNNNKNVGGTGSGSESDSGGNSSSSSGGPPGMKDFTPGEQVMSESPLFPFPLPSPPSVSLSLYLLPTTTPPPPPLPLPSPQNKKQPPSHPPTHNTPLTHPQRNADLCSRLGCAQPIYKITPDPRVPSMWSGAAYFPHDPAIVGGGGQQQSIGEVKNIYGKKKARYEVAKKVLKHLKAMQAERQKVVEGVLGTGAGVGAGAGAAAGP
ncbi:double-stranded rna-binding protein [Diplodia corticola]|uniref:Double-stranded rna-binding protein n=1 Tax=Diplodia corticola TaxID=236234 RepID=A0A1J9S7A5_9PEZI|nr:double-stranded rna-binding protein [Diplodia corticola]OJD35485.1 double-stranded rna-binding protein [Diplodia corticola]